ncbi:polyketide synthase-like protein [Nemania sp. FL0031]|nr:polyketide synthase-like protein [Nemania sp. FL0031]
MGQNFNGQMPTDASDPPCIIGIGCRLPGSIRSASELWDFLVQKKSAQGVVPVERFNIGGFYHPDGSRRAGTIDADGGYFLDEDVREFENDFFGINNLEAKYDTACSSSLVCLHTAAAALQNGECDGAIVAGANLINGIEQHMATVKGGVISPTSTCHTFDVAADGYGRAEAVSAVYLKRLSSAVRDRDPIRAVIRGTAINANGRTPGIILPSADLQEAVIRKAYRAAGLSLADTDYVECHGTGTAVGDPIEVDGIARCFGLKSGRPLMIGAIKPNVGHSEAASALSAVIKVILAFEHGKIPPTRGPRELNPKLPLESLNVKIVTELEDWPRDIRRASINAFGFGGANAHAILESYESYCANTAPKSSLIVSPIRCGQHILLPYSAASSKALLQRREHVIRAIQNHKSKTDGLRNLAYTLSERRSHFKHRGFVVCDSSANVVSGEPAQGGDQPLPIAFICTGQGAQYPGMGKELLLGSPRIFADTIRSLDGVLQRLPDPLKPDWTLSAAMQSPDASEVHRVERSQPLCTAIQIAIIAMLRSWSISPTATLGHSSGEIAAAYAAGLLTAEQAILVAYFRGYAVKKLPKLGGMMAVGVSADVATTLIADKDLSEQLCVACVNSEESVTLSGDANAIDSLFQDLKGEIFVRILETNRRGYHSHLVREVGPLYQELLDKHVFIDQLKKFVPNVGEIEMMSSVGRNSEDTKSVDIRTVCRSEYWRDNLEKPVQFNGAMKKLLTGRKLHLIEVGPHAALRSAVEQIRKKLDIGDTMPYDPTLLRGRDADVCMKSLAGNLFTGGHVLDWPAVNGWSKDALEGFKVLHSLPPYPWDYSAGLVWDESRPSKELRNRKYPRHELLGSAQLASNGIELSWRNILKLEEIPWIRDHKVETQIVFPAAAYLSMVMEAMAQARDFDSLVPGAIFSFQNVNIMAAFVIEEGASAQVAELHTTVAPRKISTSTKSTIWYEFSVSSWLEGVSTLHCSGSIRVDREDEDASLFSQVVAVDDSIGYETLATERLYAKLREKGLCFGPEFLSLASIRTDSSRVRTSSIAATTLIQRQSQNPESKHPETPYNVSPTMLDACIQAPIMGSTAGNINDLGAYLPTFISRCVVRAPDTRSVGQKALIHARARMTGPGTAEVDSTMYDGQGTPIIHFAEVRLARYNTSADSQIEESGESDLALQRHPCLRICWEPDVSRIGPENELPFRRYLSEEKLCLEDRPAWKGDAALGVLLKLAGHRQPRMNILELSSTPSAQAADFAEVLGKDTAFPRNSSWNVGSLEGDGKINISSSEMKQFDVVIVSDSVTCQQLLLHQVCPFIAPNGIGIIKSTGVDCETFESNGFRQVITDSEWRLLIPSHDVHGFHGREFLILVNKPSDNLRAFSAYLAKYLTDMLEATSVSVIALSDLSSLHITQETACISLLEAEHKFLATMTAEEMDWLRGIVLAVSDIAWITGSALFGKEETNPDLAFVPGLSRTLMLEQPLLRFSVLDVGRALERGAHSGNMAQSICDSLIKCMVSHGDRDDKEFALVDSLLYISRFVPDANMNELIGYHLGSQGQRKTRMKSLAEASPAQLCVGAGGQTESMHFQELCEPPMGLPPAGFVDVRLKAVGINAKDIYTMAGRIGTRHGTICNEVSGIVEAVGPGVRGSIALGDHVVVLLPLHFNTTERVPEWAVYKMLPTESFSVIVSLPVAYTTALYALEDCAQLKSGETILIHAGAGAVGIAAITLAQHLGATIYTTVSSQQKRDFLVSEMNIPKSHIFQSRDNSFVADIMKATEGRGVDVILNSLQGDLMHESWGCIANFGRFVEIGKRELLDAGKLDMRVFLRNASFRAFDLSDLIYDDGGRQRSILISKMQRVLQMFRSGYLRPIPTTVFDVANIVQAYRYFSTKDRIGKVVISLEDNSSRITLTPPTYQSVFSPDKVYLLIGCLGGLGRSLSRWMMARGARYFVFMGRSGCQKPEAKSLISRIQDAGGICTVVTGDVCEAADVAAAVNACRALRPSIGGVVQAAMGLQEAIFSNMSHAAWHKAVRPKWSGSWNIHKELLGKHNVDFFLMMSSVSGSVGTATESNYCAANSFLDVFARWQRQKGVPSVSVGLGMISDVGYLHENPDIEALLLRKGIQPLNEAEFLRIIDLAVSTATAKLENQGEAHILTGLEPIGIRRLMMRGFDVDNDTVRDPRTALISAALMAEQEKRNASGKGTYKLGLGENVPEWLKSVPEPVSSVLLKSISSGEQVRDALLELILKRFSDLVLLPLDQMDKTKPLSQYGMDSLIAAEFRAWFWRILKVDVPFLTLLSPTKNLMTLASLAETELVSKC